MKNILFPTAGHIYKANLHTHTTWSDGEFTPQEIKQLYKARGYQIVAFSDHEVCLDHSDLNDPEFLALTAYEMAVNPSGCRDRAFHEPCYHLNLFAKSPHNTRHVCFNRNYVRDFWPASQLEVQTYSRDTRVYSVDYVNRLLEEIREAGFLVSLNHPVWSMNYYPDYIPLKGIWGVEVFNTGCAMHGYGEDDARVYEDMLRAGIPVLPLATDDIHQRRDAFGGWIMVAADALDYSQVIRALEAGAFYASTGPQLQSLVLEDGKLKIACSPCSRIRVGTERRKAFCLTAEGELPLTMAEFSLQEIFAGCADPEKGYFRVTLVDAQGKTAYSRAYFYSEAAAQLP